jgi:hypothetical protein
MNLSDAEVSAGARELALESKAGGPAVLARLIENQKFDFGFDARVKNAHRLYNSQYRGWGRRARRESSV